MNDDEVVIVRGLEEDERVLLTAPPEPAKISLVRLPGSKAGEPAEPKVGGDTAVGKVAIPAAAAPDTARRKP